MEQRLRWSKMISIASNCWTSCFSGYVDLWRMLLSDKAMLCIYHFIRNFLMSNVVHSS